MTNADAPSYAFPQGVLAREVEGEMVLLDLNGEQYYALDQVGAAIVTRLTSSPFEQAMAELRRTYDVDAAVLSADVERLVAELLEAGLLQQSPAR